MELTRVTIFYFDGASNLDIYKGSKINFLSLNLKE